MDDFDENKIDALFQEGSERYDFKYREEAWTSMDELLDKQDKHRKIRFLGWVLLGCGVLLGVYGLYQVLTKNMEVMETPNMALSLEAEYDNVKEINPEITLVTTEKQTTKSANLLITEINTTIPDLPTTIKSVTIDNNNKTLSFLQDKPVQITVGKDQNSKSIFQNENTSLTTASIVESNVANGTTEQVMKPKEKIPVLISSGTFVSLPQPQKLVDYSAIVLPAISLEEAEEPADEKITGTNRFSIGLNVGPEFSFVGGTGDAKAGYYLGVELGYQLSDRFELITGVGISKKRYLGDGDNYKAASGFWTDEIVPMEFAGTCTVIEIPLAVNYYFNNARKNGWFASLGATTYLMSDEWYDFFYDPAVDRPDLKANFNDQMANSHLFGVGQVSFGYQQNFGKHTSLQISPYAKIPLGGIGTGSVNLFSTGLRVTARFR